MLFAAVWNTWPSGASGGGDGASRANPVCASGTPSTCTTPPATVRPLRRERRDDDRVGTTQRMHDLQRLRCNVPAQRVDRSS